MGGNHAHLPPILLRALDHVANKGVIPLALRRHAPVEAVKLVRIGGFGPPLVERERRIRHHHVELHQRIALDELRVQERVAPFDPGAILVVDEHIHSAKGPCAAVHFLPVEREVVVAHRIGYLDEE